MASITCFEDLEIWKKAQELGVLIFILCDTNRKIKNDFSFKDQMKRAVLSISNNIAEGFEYNNNNDFFLFLRIAKGSCGEVRNCLIFSLKINYTEEEDVSGILLLSQDLSRQIGGMMKYLLEKKKASLNAKLK